MSSLTAHGQPKVERCRPVTIVTFTDRILYCEELLSASTKSGHTDGWNDGHLLLDFTHIKSLSGVELGLLVTWHKAMRSLGGRLTLFNLNADVYEVLTVTRLQTVLRICRESGRTPASGRPGPKRHVQARLRLTDPTP
jgi:hypothetical protein